MIVTVVIGYLALLTALYAGAIRPFSRRRGRKALEDPRAVLMPPELISSPPRRVKDLAIGETAYILAALVDVNERGAAFVRDELEIRSEPEDVYKNKIERLPGGVRLTLRSDNLPSYKREPLYRSLKYRPVIEIRIEEPKPARREQS